jgi:AraC-like DNA-binding protein
MSNQLNPMELTGSEKKRLKGAGIKLKEAHFHSIKELQKLLNIPKIRAMEIFALSEFQSLPQIGIRFAHDLISMGFYSLKELKGKDGAKLTDKFERQSGVWSDPCVEDQFRLVVFYANHPGVHRNWWDFTPVRKAFREKHGYPASRPTRPWFELPRYQTANSINASSIETRKDLDRKLKLAIRFMKAHLGEKLTLGQLADVSHLSVYHFLRCFKSVYEHTPFQFLTHLRLKTACQLLRQTKFPVSQLVVSCGFEDQSSFTRLFNKEFKTTPTAYRELKN